MKRYALGLIFISLVGCSAQVPNASYYQNLSFSDQNQGRRPQYSSNMNSPVVLKETLYREREWHRRQIAQKDATIQGLRQELLQTRTYITELMKELTKVNGIPRSTHPLYEDGTPYQNMNYSNQAEEPSLLLVNAEQAVQVRDAIHAEPMTLQQEDEKPVTLESVPTPRTDVVTPVESSEQKEPVQQPQENKATLNNKKNVPQTAPVRLRSAQQIKPAKELYEQAMNLMEKKQYLEARAIFDSFIQQYPKDVLMPNVLYWKGETFYSLGKYADAITNFMSVINSYGKSNKAPDALLKIVMSYSALKDRNNAKKYRDALLNSYPQSASAKKARTMVF